MPVPYSPFKLLTITKQITKTKKKTGKKTHTYTHKTVNED